jgi:antirestriction protein ArdC
MNKKVQPVIENILERFKKGDLPKAVALSSFPIPNVPAQKWSLMNRIIMHFSATADARGFRQWQDAGRHVKKGAKALYILAPRIKKEKDKKTEEEKAVLIGFMVIPVFRAEDTEGDPLEYEQIDLPKLPLEDVAKKWDLAIKAVPGNTSYLGCYRSESKEICLASKEEIVFFHELAQAAHDRVHQNIKNIPTWKKEVIAEFSAAVLTEMTGKSSNLGHNYRYIETYAIT